MQKPELLAPAGDWECLVASLRFGADAVYIGGELLQLRAEKAAFSREEIVQAAALTHEKGKKLYVTVNSFPKNEELEPLRDYAQFLYDAGVDAVIVSDLGAISVIKDSVPDLPIHVSTQANCCNWASADVYYRMGAQRIVLAREMSLSEIAQLREKVPQQLELEAFVHGAMCMAYSGRCLLSSFMNGRSGNRGECTQPCRWSYYLMEQKREGEFFPIEEGERATAILSSHDLNCLSFLPELQKAGIVSFKIEGRMKTANYVATVVNAYRHAIDGDTPLPLLQREVESVSHRPFSSGFYFGELVKNHNNDGQYHADCRFAGVVVGQIAGGYLVQQRNLFRVGDLLERVTPGVIGQSFTVDALADNKGNAITAAKLVGQVVAVYTDAPLLVGDFLRLRVEKNG